MNEWQNIVALWGQKAFLGIEDDCFGDLAASCLILACSRPARSE